MGHVDERDADLLLDRLELDLHLLAELEVERAERLVEEQHAWPVDERAGESDALALAARELARLALLVALQADHPERLGDPDGPLRLRDLADHQPVGHVVTDRHVREEGVVLEDRVDVAVERRDGRHVLAVEQDAALGRDLEAGDHPQGRRLARPGRPEHREELAVHHVEVDPVHCHDREDASAIPALAARRPASSSPKRLTTPSRRTATPAGTGPRRRRGSWSRSPSGTSSTGGDEPLGARSLQGRRTVARTQGACQARSGGVPFGAP